MPTVDYSGSPARSPASQATRALVEESAAPGLWPHIVAALYGIPLQHDVAGQSVGIIAGGGGYLPDDLAAATQPGRPRAEVSEVSVDGTTNLFVSGDTEAELELALDLQILAALLPAARIVVYFAAATQEGMVQAVERAISDKVNRPSVLSISWGSPEKYWRRPTGAVGITTLDAMQTALQAARDSSVTVVAASGDQLATAGERDGRAHLLYPGSSPLVLSCGGTQLELSSDESSVDDETVWNEAPNGTGGGVSDVFAVPDYQRRVPLPASFLDGQHRRGVPDVAAAAASSPGYRIIVNGKPIAKAGTSAAAPLWAALIVMANAVRGRPLGLVNSYLYENPWICRPILSGNNLVNSIGYWAGPDWNACVGLGVPIGQQVIDTLAAV